MIRVMSDLHLEFGPLPLEPIGEDVLALVGDTGLYTDGAAWARNYARRHNIPVVMVAGNHEFYRGGRQQSHTVESTIAALRAFAESDDLLTFLEDDIAEIAGIAFVGCTLWTDFALNGNPHAARRTAAQAMNDYRLIFANDRERFTPEHSQKIHEFSAGILRERLPRRFNDGKPVVVLTHHLPSARSIAGRYASSDYNAAYASDLDGLVQSSEAVVWCHGHTHVSQDYKIGDTRVICNPRGYVGHEVNCNFNPNLLIPV